MVRYLNPAYQHPARFIKAEKDFAKRLDVKEIKFPLKTRDILKFDSISITDFGYENKVKYLIYVSKKCFEDKHVDLSFAGEREKKQYVFIKDFNIFIYDHTLHRKRRYFCCYAIN